VIVRYYILEFVLCIYSVGNIIFNYLYRVYKNYNTLIKPIILVLHNYYNYIILYIIYSNNGARKGDVHHERWGYWVSGHYRYFVEYG
jgi:hypothetical protein